MTAELTLPNVPCLVIEWRDDGEEQYIADYSLRLPLAAGDCRNEQDNARDGFLYVLIGTTSRNGGSPDLFNAVGTPYRDGAHICWDSALLRLPKYVVYGDIVQVVGDNNGGFGFVGKNEPVAEGKAP